jgi:hypothetical protein
MNTVSMIYYSSLNLFIFVVKVKLGYNEPGLLRKRGCKEQILSQGQVKVKYVI